MSEPGRYFSSNGMTLVCRIIGRRIAKRSPTDQEMISPSFHLSQGLMDDFDIDGNISQESVGNIITGACDDEPLPMLAPFPATSLLKRSLISCSEAIWTNERKNIYYINDGIYGTFNAIVFDQKIIDVHYLHMTQLMDEKQTEVSSRSKQRVKSVIFGPTCDSLDCVAHAIDLPLLDVDDILWFPNVGSYTSSSASNFNGFKTKKFIPFWNK